MRTLLLAGVFHGVLSKYGLDIINTDHITINDVAAFLQQNQPIYDQIVITDEGMIGNDEYAINSALKGLLILKEQENGQQPVMLITNNALLKEVSIPGIDIYYYCTIRVTISQYLNTINRTIIDGARQVTNECDSPTARHAEESPPAPEEKSPAAKPKKASFIERLKKDKAMFAPETSYGEKEFAFISSEISRVIAITGCRGSGVTSTAVNLAHLAGTKGLTTMLIDLDVLNCALNLYFNEYYETAEKDRDIACSLIRNLAKPQDYKLNTYFNGSLYMTTLSYSFQDKDLLERFYNTAKLVNMLSVFRKHFQVCLLDMPLEVLGRFRDSILFIDDFGLCVSNNLYALTGALRSAQSLFTQEELGSLYSKVKIIVSKYNDRSTLQEEIFSPERVCELLLDLSDTYYEKEFELAGFIPYSQDFDTQLETDIPIADSNAQMERAYTDILLRMIKGVR